MPVCATNDIRNIALVGSAGAGKTLLVEALAAAAGVIPHKGSIGHGSTVSDHLPAERASQHSLVSSVVSFHHAGIRLNVIDTPGSPDLIGRALAVLPAVETVAVVIDARSGPDLATQRMMAWAQDRGLDRLVIINRIDNAPAALAGVVARVQALFGTHCLPLNLPARQGADVVDCFFAPREVPTDFSSVAAARTALVDQVVEVDDTLMEHYLDRDEELTPAQLHDPFEVALRSNHLVPICFTSAASDAGIRELLEACCRLLPNPAEGNPPDFFRSANDDEPPLHFAPDATRHVLAHAFKIAIDPFVGRMAFLRIHQGTITAASQLYIGDARRPFTVGHLFSVLGARAQPIEAGLPGEICAIAKIEGVEFDSVLHDSHDEDQIHARRIELPPPMHAVAVHARSRGEQRKLSDALAKLSAEDPSLRIEHHHAVNQSVLRTVGELHLRALLADLRDRWHVEVEVGAPRIEYRETIQVAAEGHARHKKQTGGAGQFGEVYLRVSPLERGAGVRFVDAVVGGAIPRQFLPAVEKGVRQALTNGVAAGFPVEDIEITVCDGRYHSVDSKDVAFIAAGRKACLDALGKAGAILLEPIVTLSVVAPSARLGDLTGALTTRRGRILETLVRDEHTSVITAQVPEAELDGYGAQLKGLTAGAGSFNTAFSHYDVVPPRIQQALSADYRPQLVAD